ncbi:MAG: ABC transporter permease [Planctomycetota bacterium]|jgi:hypothetical protein
MTVQPADFDLLDGLIRWIAVFAGFVATFIVVAVATSLPLYGLSGPGRVIRGAVRGFVDVFAISPRRVFAIAQLAFRESIRRKALLVFVVFAALFMFGGWFMEADDARPDLHLRNLVAFVFFAMSWLVLPIVVLLSCWGLPEDIRLRSLHTVVTKPVRRSEVVLGRMVGFSAVGTVIIVLMSVVGYGWIMRHVTQNASLFCRVPVYGDVSFLDHTGQPKEKGVNVGDIVMTRSFIAGGTKATAIWQFPIDRESDQLTIESRFEAFRTYKGNMDRTLRVRFTLVNEETDLRVPLPAYEVNEFGFNEQVVSRNLKVTDEQTLETSKVDLFNDLVVPFDAEKHAGLKGDPSVGVLTVHAQCLDRGQYIGLSPGDCFLRIADRNFAIGYIKAAVGLWLECILFVVIAVTASCFVKFPVAFVLTSSVGVVGTFAYSFLEKIVSGEQKGGGAVESIYRLVTHMNETTELPDNTFTKAMQTFDSQLVEGLGIVRYVIPDLNLFGMSEWLAKGFDVPWNGVLLPAAAITFGYFLPCLFLGYFSLRLRELEAK